MTINWRRDAGILVALIFSVLVLGFSVQCIDGQTKDRKKSRPRTVLLIRHAEKPPEEAASVHLSSHGKKRAAVLHELFKVDKKRPEPFPTPDFIFASTNSKNSYRPVETVTPAAEKLKLPVNSRFHNKDFAGLAREILKNPRYEGKTILICWHHGTMPELARKLRVTNAPKAWGKSVFDRVWQITYAKDGTASFRDLPQKLLPKDSEK